MFSILALFGLLALVFSFWIAVSGTNYEEENTYVIFFFGLFIAGSVFASMSFNMLASKDKAIYWMSVPATHLEKLICTLLFNTVLFFVVYCLCFFLVKTIGVSYITNRMKDDSEITYKLMSDGPNGFKAVMKFFICAYFAVQALYLLGSVYFSRYSFVITTVVGSAVIFAFIYFMSKTQDILHHSWGVNSWEIISMKKFDPSITTKGVLLYEISPAVKDFLKYLVMFAWAPIFWVVTWFRLKEKQV